jgi:hypothetical protein
MWGNIKFVDEQGYPIRYEKRGDIRNGIEPRLRAIAYFPDDELRGLSFDIQRGIYHTFDRKAEEEAPLQDASRRDLERSNDNTATYSKDPSYRLIGRAGIGNPYDNNTRSGFYVRKFIDYNKPQDDCGLYRSTTHWIALRYGEVLLNRAEAAFELGLTDDAWACINLIRERAGAKLAESGNLDIQTVRDERRKELAFENHHWWDIRRWRIADKMYDNTIFNALYPYFIYDEKKYIFLEEEQGWRNSFYTFQKKFYYEGLPGGELNKNPNH